MRGPEDISGREHLSQEGPGIYETLRHPGLISHNYFIENKE